MFSLQGLVFQELGFVELEREAGERGGPGLGKLGGPAAEASSADSEIENPSK